MSTVVALVSNPATITAIDDLSADAVTVVGPGAPRIPVQLSPLPRSVERLRNLAWRTPLGRNLVRVSPFDDSRRLWRTVRKNSSIAELVRNADVVIACDRDAIYSAWQMTKRPRRFGQGWSAVYGVSAARFVLGTTSGNP